MHDSTRRDPPRLRLVGGGEPPSPEFASGRPLRARSIEIPPLRRRRTDRADRRGAALRQAAEAIDAQSRRIEDLVRELGVLGRFEEGFDGPRAA